MTFTQSIQAGVQQAWLMFYDANGDPSGDTTTALSNGQIRGSYRFRGIQSMPTGVLEAEAVTVLGDDTSLGSLLFSSDAPREFLINFGQGDLDLEGLLQNTPVENIAGGKQGQIDTPGTLATCALIVQSRAVKQNPGVAGQAAWTGWLYPFVQIQPLNREEFSGRTAGVIRYKGVAQNAFNNPWGTTIVDKQGAASSAYAKTLDYSYPVTMDAFRGNGVLDAFTLARTPILAASTDAFVDKVQIATLSINTPTARLMTLASAPTNTRPGIVLYQYQPV